MTSARWRSIRCSSPATPGSRSASSSRIADSYSRSRFRSVVLSSRFTARRMPAGVPRANASAKKGPPAERSTPARWPPRRARRAVRASPGTAHRADLFMCVRLKPTTHAPSSRRPTHRLRRSRPARGGVFIEALQTARRAPHVAAPTTDRPFGHGLQRKARGGVSAHGDPVGKRTR